MAEWMDSSSWSQGDSAEVRKTPNSWTLKKSPKDGGLSISVHRYFKCPGWFVSCHDLKISARDLGEEDVETAKRKAAKLVLDEATRLFEAVRELVQ